MAKYLLVVAVLVSSVAVAQCVDQRRVVTVEGVGEVEAAPDKATFSISVNSFDKDSLRARAENERRMKLIVAGIKAAGVAAQDAQTTRLDIEAQYKRDDETKAILGYTAKSSVWVTLRDLSKIDSLREMAFANGATGFSDLVFGVQEATEYRKQARASALKAAQAKAQFMAEQLGQTIGKAVNIVENTSTLYGYNANVVTRSSSSEDTPMPLGKISIREQVSATFELN